MPEAGEEPRELRPWDRRHWPDKGDASADMVYSSVGRTLSTWEAYDAQLGLLFSAFVNSSEENYLPAFRAYSAVRTFEGRVEMLRASSQTFFFTRPSEEQQAAFGQIVRRAKSFGPIRNDIAHGIVEWYRPEGMIFGPGARPTSPTFALLPSWANFKDRAFTGALATAIRPWK
jgi:hypothetical protein